MIRQFLQTVIHSFRRNRVITAINITGLTLGVTFTILISLYVRQEMSVDKSFRYGDSIYRIELSDPEEGTSAVMGSALGPDLKESIAGIDDALRIQFWDRVVLRNDDADFFSIPRICLADSNFFDFFEHTWVYGSPHGALNKPYSIVLTDVMASTIFGTTNPVGNVLTSQSGKIYTITGVVKKRYDSHFTFDALLSLVTRGETSKTILHTYSTNQWLTYFKAGSNIDIDLAEEQIRTKIFELIPQLAEIPEYKNLNVVLNPLKEIYFDKPSSELSVMHGNKGLVRVFIAVAFLIITIACINFVNLSTATAVRRSKEVGIRKLAGSDRRALIARFMAESVFVSFISTALGLILSELLLPYFNNMTGGHMDITYCDNLYTIPFLAGLIVVTGLLAGLYPAYYISSYQTIQVVRGEVLHSRGARGFRRGLIFFQFLISVILINGSLLISKQLRYTREKDLGFEKEMILTVDLPSQVLRNSEVVRERLLEYPEITNVSYSYTIPGSSLNYEGFNINNKTIGPMVFSIDPYYAAAFGLDIVAGRNFDADISSDSVSNCLINETLAREIGLDDPVDQYLLHDSWYITMFPVSRIRIIGVVKDFHFKSLRSAIDPLVLAWNPDWFGYMNVRIAQGKTASAMERIKSLMNEYAPGVPLEYQFIEESFDMMYRSDERMGRIIVYFTLLAIFIGVLGLFGMATFMAGQKRKEIALRKINGASISSLIMHLSRELLALVIAANATGWPVVLWLGNRWLNDFAYKTEIGAAIFVYGTVISISIALITVLSVTVKAACSNPVEALRYE